MTRLRQHDIKNKTNVAIQIAEAVQDNVATGARFASGAYDGLDISILAGWRRVMDVGWGFTKEGTKCVSHCSIIDFSHVKNLCNHNVPKKNTKRILKHVFILLTSRILLLVGSVVHLPAGECVTGLFIWPQLRHAVMLYTPPALLPQPISQVFRFRL